MHRTGPVFTAGSERKAGGASGVATEADMTETTWRCIPHVSPGHRTANMQDSEGYDNQDKAAKKTEMHAKQSKRKGYCRDESCTRGLICTRNLGSGDRSNTALVKLTARLVQWCMRSTPGRIASQNPLSQLEGQLRDEWL
eukprot:461302-Rhodomonas_salina.1